jgi:flagellar basal-body rod modification protein FlgD
LDSLQSKQLMTSQLNSASLIGKHISAHGDQLILDEKGSADAHYQLAANAAKVTVQVMNTTGQTVRQIEALNQQAGECVVRWDGRDQLGKTLPQGVYRFEVNAVDAAGKSIASAKQTRGVVTGLNLEGAEPILEIGSLQIPLSAVTQVR